MPIPQLTNLFYKEQERGKIIHSSKIHYHWGFAVNDINHTIELIDSRLSTKKQIIINGKVLYKGEGQDYITKTFDIAEHTFVLIPFGSRYELRVDGSPFKHLMMIEENKKPFTSSKSLQNWQIDEPEEKLIPQRAQSNLEVNKLFSFDIKPKQPKTEVVSWSNIEMNNNRDSNYQVSKADKEVNLLDLEFSHPQPVYHPYSSNNFNFNYSDQQYAHYDKNQYIPYQVLNSNANSVYSINPVQTAHPMINYFD